MSKIGDLIATPFSEIEEKPYKDKYYFKKLKKNAPGTYFINQNYKIRREKEKIK